MDSTAPRTKPRCRLFDRAINSVKNQSSSPKLKWIEEKDNVPCIFVPDGSSINVGSQDLASTKTHEVQYSFIESNESKNCGSNLNGLSINANIKTHSEEKLFVDSSSNKYCDDYNLPIFHSSYSYDNPEILSSSNLNGPENTCFSSNNILAHSSFPEHSYLESFKLMYDTCMDKTPDISSDKSFANTDKSRIFEEKGISQTILPCTPSSITKGLYSDEMATMGPSDTADIGKKTWKIDFIETCSEDARCIKNELALSSTSSLLEYSVNKSRRNDLACDQPSKSDLLVDQKCVNISLSKTKPVSEPKSTSIDSIQSNVSNSDNQDSGFIEQKNCFQAELISGYSVPIEILVSESNSAIDKTTESRWSFESNYPNINKTGRSIKVTVEVLDSDTSNVISRHSSISNFSESSSACMLPITVQIAEYEDEFSKPPIRYSSAFPNEKSEKSTMSDSYNLPVAIFISESGNSSLIQLDSASNFNTINEGCAIGLNANNSTDTEEWNRERCEITSDFLSDKSYSDQLADKKYDANDFFPAHTASAGDKCMRSFPLGDGLKSHYMGSVLPKDFNNTKAVSFGEASHVYNSQKIVPESAKMGSFSDTKFADHTTGLKVYKNNFSPESLCESCFLEYSFQHSMFITQFKDREVDSSECTCILQDSRSDIVSEEQFVNLPRFSSPESTNFKHLDLTLSPINETLASTDWNLSQLPNDFSLPISSSCCELNPFFQEGDESVNQYRIKSYSSDNYEFKNVSRMDGSESNFSNQDRGERFKIQNGGYLVQGYDLRMLYSTNFDNKFIDAHCHLDFLFQKLRYRGTFSEYRSMNEASFPKNYEGCIAVFCEPDTFIKSYWEKHLTENVWATFGCHPHFSRFYCERYEKAILEALNHPQVKALGEIGLDYSKNNHCTREIQHKVFQRQLKICVSRKLPLVLHCRDAHEDTLKFAVEILPKDQKIHLHCFTDTWYWAKKWMEAFPNLCIGFTNHISLNMSKDVLDVVTNMPLNRVLLETDAPYFLPKVDQVRKYSHPGMAIHVAAQIATIKDIPIEKVLYWTRRNTNFVYQI